jgi:hypothetical protein
MTTRFDIDKLSSLPKNRYEALDEVQRFLSYNGVDVGQAFEVLLTSHDGYLIYWFGDIQIQFTRGFGVSSGSSYAVQMSLELDNEKTKKTIVYEYLLRDLKLVKRRRLTDVLRTRR